MSQSVQFFRGQQGGNPSRCNQRCDSGLIVLCSKVLSLLVMKCSACLCGFCLHRSLQPHGSLSTSLGHRRRRPSNDLASTTTQCLDWHALKRRSRPRPKNSTYSVLLGFYQVSYSPFLLWIQPSLFHRHRNSLLYCSTVFENHPQPVRRSSSPTLKG